MYVKSLQKLLYSYLQNTDSDNYKLVSHLPKLQNDQWFLIALSCSLLASLASTISETEDIGTVSQTGDEGEGSELDDALPQHESEANVFAYLPLQGILTTPSFLLPHPHHC